MERLITMPAGNTHVSLEDILSSIEWAGIHQDMHLSRILPPDMGCVLMLMPRRQHARV
jgi:hypothetical protein